MEEFAMRDEKALELFPDRASNLAVESPKANQTPPFSRQGRIQPESSGPPCHPTRTADRSADNHSGRGRQVAPEDRLLTVDEFADSLRVSRACVRRWILERKVGVVKVG